MEPDSHGEKGSPFDRQWDVAVVGAGPSGAAAAFYLASKSHRVVLLDKENFPRDKVCGDCLTIASLFHLEKMGF